MILVRDDIQDVIEIESFRTDFLVEVIGVEIKGNHIRPQLNVITYYNPPQQNPTAEFLTK